MKKPKNVDAGMAFVLISLIGAYFLDLPYWKNKVLLIGILLLILNMVSPRIYRVPGLLWIKLGEWIGKVSSIIFLSIVFFVIVTPIGLFRQILGKDPLRRKEWKKNDQSIFITRKHTYSSDDLKYPF